jgi:hypothetical protein
MPLPLFIRDTAMLHCVWRSLVFGVLGSVDIQKNKLAKKNVVIPAKAGIHGLSVMFQAPLVHKL